MISRHWVAFLLCTAFLSVPASAQDWPQWRGPNRDGNVSGAVIPTSWPKALKEQWKVTVGIGHSSPVVSKGRIYVFARQGEEEVLLSLDAGCKTFCSTPAPEPFPRFNQSIAAPKNPHDGPSATVHHMGIPAV